MPFVVKQGSASVTLDDGLEKFARQAVDNSMPGVLAIMEARVGVVAAEARAEWPVDTGVSLAGLEEFTEVNVTAGTVRAAIRNPVPYTLFIRPKKWHGAATAWQRLVRGPMTALYKQLADELGPAIVSANSKRRGG